MSKHDDQMRRDINETYARRDRGELTERQMLDKLKQVHDTHLAACKADYERRGGAR